MAAQSNTVKVLRICIIQDRDVLQERLIKAGDSVRVGESAKNTFVIPKTSLPAAEFPMFVNKGGKYHLQFTSSMRGKISSGGAVVGLDKLRADPSVAQQGDVWRYQLSVADKGKIAIDNVTVLFQFVQPPPVQAMTPIEGMDFRPLLFDEDDPALYGFLALFTALAMVFSLFIYVVPVPPMVSSKEIKDRFAHIAKQIKEREEVEPPEIDPDEALKAQRKDDEKPEKKPEEKAPDPVEKKPKTKLEKAQEREAQKAALKSQIKIARIGTRGRSSGGTTSDAYESSVLGNLDSLDGDGVALAGEVGGLRKGDTSREDVTIGDMKADGASTTSGATGPAVDTSKYKVQAESGDTADMEGAEDVEAVVKQRQGQLMYCYENELRADPGLSGRVEVEWQVSNKRVTSIRVASNSTGNDELAACIVKKIKRWRFGEGVQGAVSWPFVFRKK